MAIQYLTRRAIGIGNSCSQPASQVGGQPGVTTPGLLTVHIIRRPASNRQAMTSHYGRDGLCTIASAIDAGNRDHNADRPAPPSNSVRSGEPFGPCLHDEKD